MTLPSRHLTCALVLGSVALGLFPLGCGGSGGFGGHSGTSNVNYKFSSGSIGCGGTLVITDNTGTFPSSATVSFLGITGTYAATVSLDQTATQLSCTIPSTAPSGVFDVILAENGSSQKIGTVSHSGCTN